MNRCPHFSRTQEFRKNALLRYILPKKIVMENRVSEKIDLKHNSERNRSEKIPGRKFMK